MIEELVLSMALLKVIILFLIDLTVGAPVCISSHEAMISAGDEASIFQVRSDSNSDVFIDSMNLKSAY